MDYRITHRTEFSYAHPVATSYQLLHLTPRSFTKQQVVNAQLQIHPVPGSSSQRQDYFGNTVQEVSAPASGVLLILFATPPVNEGDNIVVIGEVDGR